MLAPIESQPHQRVLRLEVYDPLGDKPMVYLS